MLGRNRWVKVISILLIQLFLSTNLGYSIDLVGGGLSVSSLNNQNIFTLRAPSYKSKIENEDYSNLLELPIIKLDEIDIPLTAGILIKDNQLSITVRGRKGDPSYSYVYRDNYKNYNLRKKFIINAISEAQEKIGKRHRIHALGIVDQRIENKVEENMFEGLITTLFLKKDILLYTKNEFVSALKVSNINNVNDVEKITRLTYDNRVINKILLKDGTVQAPPLLGSLNPYREILSQIVGEKEANQRIDKLENVAKEFNVRGLKALYINSTIKGGGVATMRWEGLRIARLLGIDVDWAVMDEGKGFNIFDITKKWHNTSQGVQLKGQRDYTIDQDKAIYEAWTEYNAYRLKEVIEAKNVFIIDDPQAAGLISWIKKWNPNAKIIWRCHIHLRSDLVNTKDEPAAKIWDYLYNDFIQYADRFVFHKKDEFIPEVFEKSKIRKSWPATSPLDGLTKPLSEKQIEYYIDYVLNIGLMRLGQTPIDRNKQTITQIARFDPAKGIPDVLEAYRIYVEKLVRDRGDDFKLEDIPQLIIAGNIANDDPDYETICCKTIAQAKILFNNSNLPEEIKKTALENIKIIILTHNDQMLNAIFAISTVILQLSHFEGAEFKITEALLHQKPVIIYDAGGMPSQVTNGKNGYIVDVGDIQTVAEKIEEILQNPDKLKEFQQNAMKYINPEFISTENLKWFLKLMLEVTNVDDNNKLDIVPEHIGNNKVAQSV